MGTQPVFTKQWLIPTESNHSLVMLKNWHCFILKKFSNQKVTPFFFNPHGFERDVGKFSKRNVSVDDNIIWTLELRALRKWVKSGVWKTGITLDTLQSVVSLTSNNIYLFLKWGKQSHFFKLNSMSPSPHSWIYEMSVPGKSGPET